MQFSRFPLHVEVTKHHVPGKSRGLRGNGRRPRAAAFSSSSVGSTPGAAMSSCPAATNCAENEDPERGEGGRWLPEDAKICIAIE